MNYSAQKYSSFICELYIKIISPEERKELIDSMNIGKTRCSNNHHRMKIFKIIYTIKNNIFNESNSSNKNALDVNNNSNGNNNINNINIPYNNTNDPNDNF